MAHSLKFSGTGSSTTATINVSLTGTYAQGDTIFVAVTLRDGSATVSGVTCGGDSLTQIATVFSTTDIRIDLWAFTRTASSGSINPTAAVTLSGAAAGGAAAVAAVYSGGKFAVAVAMDKTQTSSGSSTAPDTGTTASTTQGDELWLAVLGWRSNDGLATGPTNGFSVVGSVASGTTVRCSLASKHVTSTGTANTGGTLSTSRVWGGIVACFRAGHIVRQPDLSGTNRAA